MWLQVQALQLSSFVNSGELFNQSDPQFSHLQNGFKNSLFDMYLCN